jgi:xanthine dehydrogenase accessory factor
VEAGQGGIGTGMLPHVLVVGGGELGSAVSHRLVRSGIPVFVIDLDRPRCIRRRVCFATACYTGSHRLEGVTARKSGSVSEARDIIAAGEIPVLTGDAAGIAAEVKPEVLVDARMLKSYDDNHFNLAPLVIGLGPGFTAGRNAHVVVETNRGHNLGRVIYTGGAEARTGVPAEVMGFAAERVVRAPGDGVFSTAVEIGQVVAKGAVLGTVDGKIPVRAEIEGMVRGLIADGLQVARGRKIGDIDPRGRAVDPGTISDKGRAVAGGVLEAIMHWWMVSRHA